MATPNDISTPSGEYKRLSKFWKIIADVLGGTDAMRVAGTTYLPKHPAESDKNYRIRIETATFAPLFKIMSENMKGRIFSKEMKIVGAEKDKQIPAWIEDIDTAGNHLNIFCQNVFQNVLNDGRAYIFIDFQKDAPNNTQEQEAFSGARPYFVSLKACDVLGVDYEKNGVTIKEARIKEEALVKDGYAEKEVERIRVLRPGSFEVYEKQADQKKQDMWILAESGAMTVSITPPIPGQEPTYVVPLVPIYAGQKCDKPPLLEAAYLNIKYYQFESNHDNALTVAQFPILGATGISEEDDAKIQIGPKKLLSSSNQQARFFYLEHSGVAIGCGRQRLLDIKSEMAAMGMKLLQPIEAGAAAKTATESSIDADNNTCTLQAMSFKFADGVEHALGIMAQWVSKQIELEVQLHGSFNVQRNDPSELTALMGLKQGGDLSQKTLWEEFKRRSVLSDSFDPEKEKEYLADEGPVGLGANKPAFGGPRLNAPNPDEMKKLADGLTPEMIKMMKEKLGLLTVSE